MARSFDKEKRQASKAGRELASTLEWYREASGATKKEFAETLGISTQYLHALLDGTGNPSLESLEAMAERLGLDFTPVFRAPLTRTPAKRTYTRRTKPESAPSTDAGGGSGRQRASRSRSSSEASRQPRGPK